jgi:polyhydroxybutyrate depolymerase
MGGATGGSGGAGGTGGATGGSGGTGATGGAAGATGGSGGAAGKGGASGSGGAAGSAGKSGSAGSGGTTDGGAGSSGAGGNGGTTDGGGSAGAAGAAGSGRDGGSPEGGACIGDYVPGDYPPAVDDANAWLTISGLPNQPGPRQYKVHVPPSYDCKVPTPVVYCIHGLAQNGVMLCVNGSSGKTMPNTKGFVDKSNEAGFILVMPNGQGQSWNGGTGHYGDAANQNLDDVGFMKAILANLKTHLNVDARKVYATGLSNGGYMSYRLGCEAADVFTAVAPAAGGIVDKTGCSPSKPMSVLDLHGTADNLVPFSEQLPSANAIATKNGCTTMTTTATVPASGGDTTCVTYSGCPSGIEVTRCTIQGGGHVWFGDPSCGTGAGPAGCVFVGANSTFLNNTDVVWDFFKRLSR